MKQDADKLLQQLAQTLIDKKGFNLLALDVREVSSITDYILIAEGNVERHVQAMALALQQILDEEGWAPAYVEGLAEGQWIVIDCWQMMIHLFVPEMRNQYRLERLWEKAKIIDLPKTEGVRSQKE